MNRRRALQTLFCSSLSLGLGLKQRVWAGIGEQLAAVAQEDRWQMLAMGDFGSARPEQSHVARAMRAYRESRGSQWNGVLLLGDNFYGAMPGGIASPRWRSGFEEMYPREIFPEPCWAILGNHDYHDEPGNARAQLAYAAQSRGSGRWRMPREFYRIDFSRVTILMVDTNWKSINRAVHPDGEPCWLDEATRLEQTIWLKKQLDSPRAEFTIVCGHHPLYSDGIHGDTQPLIEEWAGLFEKHRVAIYLAGHDHDLQHLEFADRATSYVISGGGGASVRPVTKLRRENTYHADYGFSHLSIENDRLFVRHLTADGRVVHAFSKGKSLDFRLEV